MAFERSDKFLQSFYEFLMIFWENEQINVEIFKSDQLSNPDDAIRYTLQILNYQQDKLEKEIPWMVIMIILIIIYINLRRTSVCLRWTSPS